MTRKPCSSSSRDAPSAASAPPMMTGTIGLCASGMPAARVKACALATGRAAQSGSRFDQVERRDCGGDHGGRQAGGIDQRAGAVVDQVDDRRAMRTDRRRSRRSPSTAYPSATARRPCALREGRAAAAAHHADSMRVVGQEPGIVARASAPSAGSGARSPSMEKTPSVAIRAWRWWPRCSPSRLRHGRRRCGGTPVPLPPVSRAPAHRQECASSSTSIRSSCADEGRNDPRIGEVARAEHAGRFGLLEPRQPASSSANNG